MSRETVLELELHNVSDLCVDDHKYHVVLILLLLSVYMFK